ncbi:MAG TPA: hypothetical protein VF002_09365 [Gaiellaceae bacterium]
MSEQEPEQEPKERPEPAAGDLLEEQEGKGFGEDEGERDESLPEQ